MLVIRLSRTGRKKQPYYRVVVAEKSAPIKGRFVEVIGHYNPRTKDLKIDADRAKARLKDGAQPSETAEALLEKAGVLKRDKIVRKPERKKKKDLKAEAAESPTPTKEAPAEGKAQDKVEAKKDDKPEAKKPAVEAKADKLAPEAKTEPEPKPADATKDKGPAKPETKEEGK